MSDAIDFIEGIYFNRKKALNLLTRLYYTL